MEKPNTRATVAVFAVFLAFGLAGPIAGIVSRSGSVNLGSAGNFVVLTQSGILRMGSRLSREISA